MHFWLFFCERTGSFHLTIFMGWRLHKKDNHRNADKHRKMREKDLITLMKEQSKN